MRELVANRRWIANAQDTVVFKLLLPDREVTHCLARRAKLAKQATPCVVDVEIGPLAATPNLGVSTGYACEAAPCNRTNLNKQRAKQFSRQAVNA